jgi:hypothetical protein
MIKNRKIKESLDLIQVPKIKEYQNFTRGLLPNSKLTPIKKIEA